MNEKNDFLSLKLNNYFKDSPGTQYTLWFQRLATSALRKTKNYLLLTAAH